MLTRKQRVFVEEYLTCWNATRAAERAGYAFPNKQGPRLLVNVGVDAFIQERMKEKVMSADENLLRLSQQARADIGDFMDIESMSFALSMKKAKERGLTHLIKKVKQRTTIDAKAEIETHDLEIELLDPQNALIHIGRHHKLFTDVYEGSGTLNIVGLEQLKDMIYGNGTPDDQG